MAASISLLLDFTLAGTVGVPTFLVSAMIFLHVVVKRRD